MTTKVLMYCIENHRACTVAEEYLRSKGVTDIEIAYIDRDNNLAKEMWARSERRTLPQIFIGQQHIGSLTEMVELDNEGGLDPLLQAD